MEPLEKAEILESLRLLSKNTLTEHLGIELISITEEGVKGKMPVNEKTIQPMGYLHGGASVVLAETLGSIASMLKINTNTHSAFGLEINANHVRSVKAGGVVFGEAKAIHIGKSTHVWDIHITDERDRLVCVSRLTVAVAPIKD